MRSGRDTPAPVMIGAGHDTGAMAPHPPERHILLGVSHPSDDPALHRVFQVRASFIRAVGAWVARVAEQNLNEQRGDWGPGLAGTEREATFPTAALCLGDAVARIIAAVDREANEASCLRGRGNLVD